jgi:anion-transporting  ArsA/GET3 family ATPase
MDPEACIEEYGMMVLRSRALYRAVVDNRMVKGFLRAIPGMDAWSMLGKALFHAHEKGEDGRPRYDLVILDAPATGHGLQMLRVPKVITEVAPIGLLRGEAEKGLALLRDPAQAGMVVVTLAEEMPTSETEELHRALTQELKLPVAQLVINQVLAPVFSARTELSMAAADVLARAPAFGPIANAGRSRARREELQRRMIERLARLPGDKCILPALAVERMGRPEVETLARGLGSVVR